MRSNTREKYGKLNTIADLRITIEAQFGEWRHLQRLSYWTLPPSSVVGRVTPCAPSGPAEWKTAGSLLPRRDALPSAEIICGSGQMRPLASGASFVNCKS